MERLGAKPPPEPESRRSFAGDGSRKVVHVVHRHRVRCMVPQDGRGRTRAWVASSTASCLTMQ